MHIEHMSITLFAPRAAALRANQGRLCSDTAALLSHDSTVSDHTFQADV